MVSRILRLGTASTISPPGRSRRRVSSITAKGSPTVLQNEVAHGKVETRVGQRHVGDVGEQRDDLAGLARLGDGSVEAGLADVGGEHAMSQAGQGRRVMARTAAEVDTDSTGLARKILGHFGQKVAVAVDQPAAIQEDTAEVVVEEANEAIGAGSAVPRVGS